MGDAIQFSIDKDFLILEGYHKLVTWDPKLRLQTRICFDCRVLCPPVDARHLCFTLFHPGLLYTLTLPAVAALRAVDPNPAVTWGTA